MYYLADFLLSWFQIAASFFVTMLLFWLGFSIVLASEKKSFGVWFGGLGFIGGGIFFAAHTVMLDYSLELLIQRIQVWWYAGWLALIAMPGGWYGLMLWYAGYWDGKASTIYRRHRLWAPMLLVLSAALAAAVAALDPMGILTRMADLNARSMHSATPLAPLVIGFPAYLVICVWLALDALQHPNPSGRFMGDLARRRARPWLVASTLVQLFTALFIAATILYMIGRSALDSTPNIVNRLPLVIDVLEITVTSLVGIAVMLTGKAIISYELFSASVLPRGGFFKQWRGVVLTAAVYSLLISLSMGFTLQPVVQLLLGTVLLCVFMALWSRSAVAERERNFNTLRPFVSNQHFLDNLLDTSKEAGEGAGISASFHALCADLLGAGSASLHATGALAPLVGASLYYRASAADGSVPPIVHDENFSFNEAFLLSISPKTLCLALPPVPEKAQAQGRPVWAVPLWSGNRNAGVLLLGEKQDGSLYTQEEMEIARAGGERLLDARAGAALSQKLMGLQRRRIAQENALGGGVDNRVRRALHDDILPQLHTAMLSLSALGSTTEAQEALGQLAGAHRHISDLLRDMPSSVTPEIERLGLLGALRRTVELEMRGAFDEVTWSITESAEATATALPHTVSEVLFYAAREALRNAARYGRGNTEHPLHVTIAAGEREGLRLTITDDGVGLDAGIASQGSGQGLALHSTMMAVVGGTLEVESPDGGGTRVSLRLPEEGVVVEAAP